MFIMVRIFHVRFVCIFFVKTYHFVHHDTFYNRGRGCLIYEQYYDCFIVL